MGKVVFKLDADEAKAVGAFMKVVDAQKKTERQFGKSTQAGKRFSGTMGGLQKTMMGLAGGLVGAAGLRMAIGAVTQDLEKAKQATMGFEEELSGLLSLGENVRNIRAIKNEVIDMSSAVGISTKNVIDTMFSLQSGASDLSKEIREGILKEGLELHKLTGTDLQISVKALNKIMHIYRDELKSVNDAQNKLMFTADKADLTFFDIAQRLADVASAAKGVKFGINEVLAGLIAATMVGGKTERTFVQYRNILVKTIEAEKEGIKLTGDLADQFEQLTKLPPLQLKKLVGVENFPLLVAMGDQISYIRENLQAINKISPEMDITLSKLQKRLFTDAEYMFKETMRSMEQTEKNVYLRKRGLGAYGQFAIDWRARVLGAKEAMPAGLQGVAPILAANELLWSWIGAAGFLKQGRQQMIRTWGKRGETKPLAEYYSKFWSGYGPGELDFEGIEKPSAEKYRRERIEELDRKLDDLTRAIEGNTDAHKKETTTSRSRQTE